MKRIFITSLLLACVGLACTLTAQSQPANTHAAINPRLSMQTPTPTPSQIPALGISQDVTPAPPICQVKTGLSEGRLNIRACGGLACPVLAVIVEGDTLTIIQTVNPSTNSGQRGWLEVQTAGRLRGWVNSNYCPLAGVNEVKK
jgi:hypothetical protein